MAPARKILIADPDLGPVRPLTKALRARGYHVQYAPDGTKALELAVLRHPDVILFDDQCKLIEARSFMQILNTNPRTAGIPIVVTTSSRDTGELRGLREGFLQKPYNLDEVISRIDLLCRRAEAGRELRGDPREIEGGLGQLPLADLLQILSMNRRTGKLVLTHGQVRGEIHLTGGRPVDARTGSIEGEKALFRLIAWREGSFAFMPGPPHPSARIDRQMEDALLEGMRQSDERARLLSALPPLHQLLSVAPESTEPVDPHPVTAEVLRVLAQPRRLSEILDFAGGPDLEVLAAVAALLQHGVVKRHQGTAALEGPLLGTAEVHALRGKLMRGRAARNALVAKIVICGSAAKSGRWLLRSLPGLVSSVSDPGCLRSSFGTLGRLEVSDVLRCDFVYLPTTQAARPLWRPFISGALGAIVFETSEAALALARFCAFEMRLPVVLATKTASPSGLETAVLPATLRGAPLGATLVRSDISTVVRSLLLAAMAAPTTGEGTEGGIARPRPGSF